MSAQGRDLALAQVSEQVLAPELALALGWAQARAPVAWVLERASVRAWEPVPPRAQALVWVPAWGREPALVQALA